jgi:hypothetical protein
MSEVASPDPAQPAPAQNRRQRLLRRAAEFAALLLVAAIAIAVALQVTPMQTVNIAGQVVTVGTTAPSWSLSGPGEVDLFGQSLPTTLQFPGPIRPRLALSQITINSELTNFVRGAGPAGAERVLGSRLADGWIHYFAWETAIAGLGALVLLGAVAGWRRLPRRTTIVLLAVGLLVTVAINAGAIFITASRAPALLRQVNSLNELVGSEPPAQVHVKGRPLPKVQAVVMGDSTCRGPRPPGGRPLVPPGPCLRPESGLLRTGPRGRQRLAGAEPRLQQRDDRPRAAGYTAPARQENSSAARNGAAGA